MGTAGLAADFCLQAPEHAADLGGIRVAAGVGQADLVDACLGHRQAHAQGLVVADGAREGAAEGDRDARLDRDAGEARVAQGDDLADFVDQLRGGLADVRHRVLVGHRDRQRELVHARLEGVLRAAQVGREHGHVQARDRQRMRDHLLDISHLRQKARRYEGAHLDLLEAGRGQCGNPAQLGLGRHDALDALQAVARADLADQHAVWGRCRHGAAP
ncbi:Uncharacterised protein [Burkholderia gladioli]|nr:Uncharacterised protein [Burkholderia gladioli]